jgi:hypothetical protein
MRLLITIFFLLIASVSFTQTQPINKFYIVEGVVADRETLQPISLAILFNDSLGVTTTSDNNGYFKVVVPLELIRKMGSIPIRIIKYGYKLLGSGFSYNPINNDSALNDNFEMIVWNYDVKIFWLAKIQSSISSTVSANAPAKEGTHGSDMIKLTFENVVSSDLRDKKFEQLKQGNDKVYFKIGKDFCFATARYDIIAIGKLKSIYIDDKKITLNGINKVVKRNEIAYDKEKSTILSKEYGKETLVFTTRFNPEQSSFKATLLIELDN